MMLHTKIFLLVVLSLFPINVGAKEQPTKDNERLWLVFNTHAEHFTGNYNEENYGIELEWQYNSDYRIAIGNLIDSHHKNIYHVSWKWRIVENTNIDFGLSASLLINHTTVGTVLAPLPYITYKINDNLELRTIIIPTIEDENYPIMMFEINVGL